MTNHTNLALLCAVVILGLLIPPVLAVETAPGISREFIFPGGQGHPDVDGNMVVCEYSLLNGPRDIYCMNTSGSGLRPITNDPASQERPSISGDYVVWQDNRNGNWDIYLYSFSKNETTRLTTDTADQWLPVIHGNYVVWYDNRGGSTDICLYDIGTGGEKALIDCNPEIGTDVTKFKPAVSEKYVAWEETGAGIWLYEIATGAKKAVSSSSMPQSWPSIAGDFIAWEDYRWGAAWESAIYLRNLNTNEERQLTTLSNEQVSPALSGSIIAWEDKRDGLWSIYMYDLSDGVEEMSVPTAGGEQIYPAVSGNTIVWQKNRGEFANICIYTYDPGEPVHTVTRIEVEPSTATMETGEEIKFNATCYDEDDNVMPDLKVAWSCSNATVGFIDPGGYFLAYEAGTATITAATAGVSAQATVTVNAPEQVLTTMEVVPPVATVAVGGTREFAVVCYDQSGSTMTGVSVAWASSNTTVGTVNESGTFIALAAGTADLTATAGAKSAKAVVTVIAPVQPVLVGIEVAPASATIAINDTQTFSATALDQFGNTMTGVPMTWASSNETVGTIDADGTFTALAQGTATVTASADNVTGSATVTVTAEAPVITSITVTPVAATLVVSDLQQFTATALDQFGNAMTGVTVAWSSSNETVGTIDASGVFTALAAGTATVTASAGSVSGTAAVTVTTEGPVGPVDPVLTSLKVTPPGAILAVGGNQKFTVTGYDQENNVMPTGKIVWKSSNETAGTVEANGIFTALAEGTATVTATAGSVSGSATVTVNAKESALGKVMVSPSAVTLAVGDTREFSVVAFDRFGSIVPDAEVTWTCSDETVGTIDTNGIFTALDDGTTTVTATGDGAAGTATVTVNCDEPVLSRIEITPSTIALAAGDTATFTAALLDQDGCEIPGVVIDWACSDSCVGTIGFYSGFFTALDAGTATITATAEGVTGIATVTVTDACSGVVVSPSAITLEPGDSRQFAATVFDAEGNVTPDAAVTWSCDDETVGTIAADGLFTAVCGGTATVTASIDGTDETGTATVTVRSTSPVLARIVVSPPCITITAGTTLTLTATAFDRYGGEMPEVEIAWTTCDPAVGTIDDCGTFTALAAGTVTVTASAGEIAGSACVTVEPSPPVPTCIEIEPATATVRAGETQAFTATVFDQRDNVMDCVEVTWATCDPEVGTIDATGLFVASGTGTTTVTASAGCAGVTATVTVTAAPTPEPTAAPTTPVSAGSGSSGGDSSPTFDAGMHENLAAGQTFTFSSTTSSVGSVSITAANTIPKLMLTVKKATPSGTKPPAGDIYEYVEITLNWANPDDIDNAVIEFTIPAAWLEDHGMTSEDVRFMRCVDGAWQTLDTVVLGEENGLYRFRATTPGFSTFAIAAAPADVTAAAAPTGVTALAEELNVTAEVTGTPEETGNVTAEPTETTPAATPAAPLVYAPFLAPLAFLLWARKNH